jgi:hypothetical protein
MVSSQVAAWRSSVSKGASHLRMTRHLHLLLPPIHACSDGMVLDSPDERGAKSMLASLWQHAKATKLQDEMKREERLSSEMAF